MSELTSVHFENVFLRHAKEEITSPTQPVIPMCMEWKASVRASEMRVSTNVPFPVFSGFLILMQCGA